MKIKKLLTTAILAAGLAIFTACGGGNDEQELLVGAAMSLIDVNAALEAAFTELHPNINIEFTHASSGALQGQIEEGAPIDVFMSAALAQMNNLDEQNLIYSRGNLVRNSVALVVPVGSTLDINGFADIALVDRLGIGDEAMPIGNFGRQAFDFHGVLDAAEAASVRATEVRMLLTWVELGEVDAGVVFLTDAVTSDLVRVVEVADPSWHNPSINPVGIVEGTDNMDAAQTFKDFLFSPAARAIFENFGFTMYN
ncbi:MAG: molybdate ABC transporter substrate-binding protein [Defluviitaleaceae bacterium]|nr:molybdate ABC transporter substrate-binding protein [Defluviitaleaceae bacterium]